MLGEIAAIYRASKKKKDINMWTEWVCRPPAAVVVYLLKNTPVTPNQVTFFSFVVAAIAGAMFITLPGHAWLIVTAVVFEFSFVLDCADGQLARIRKSSSILGHLLDFLMDEIKAMMIFGCVAVSLLLYADDSTLRIWERHEDVWFLIVGLIGLFALATGLMLTSFTRRPEYSGEKPTEDGQPAVMKKRSGPLGLALSLFEHGARIIVHYPSYIWLCAAVGHIEIYFYAYTVINVLYAGRMGLTLLVRLGRFGAPP